MKKLLFSFLLFISVLAIKAQIIHVSEDFNTSVLPFNWTSTAVSGSQIWSFGINASSSLAGNTNINGTALAYFDDDVLGGTSLNNTADLLTPTFDNSAIPVTFLEFDYNFYQFGPILDSFIVDVWDGTNWIRVLSRGSDDCGRWILPSCINSFPHALIDISSFANANCQVRFRYFDGNDWGFQAGIDNVEIYSIPKYNLELSAVISPTNSCGLSAAENAQIEIRNIGTDSVQNFSVFMDVNQGAQLITDTLPIAIAPDSTYIHTFTNTLNLSAVTSYNLQAYLRSSQDSVKSNDSLLVIISNDTIYNGNYFENFETPNHGWTVSGTNASWAWGAPNGININSAFSGNNAFVTNLTGNYNNNELSYLISPCFDFSNYSNDPIVSFALIHRTEAGFDQLWLEYTTDKGVSWNKVVEDTLLSLNWYNNNIDEVWDGINNNWNRVENLLNGLAGLPNVKFRFVFESDNSAVLEGIGIDDFSFFEQLNNIQNLKTEILADNCSPSREYPIKTTFRVSSDSIILPNTVSITYVINGISFPSEIIPDTLFSNSVYKYTFQNLANFSNGGVQEVKTYFNFPADTTNLDDTSYTRFKSVVSALPYFEGFENIESRNGSFCNIPILTYFPDSNINNFAFIGDEYKFDQARIQGQTNWAINKDTLNLCSTPFAYSGKNSIASIYQFSPSKELFFELPCFDLNNYNRINFSFAYVKNNLIPIVYVEAKTDSNWVKLDSIVNNTIIGTPYRSNYIIDTISLDNYIGDTISLRFSFITAGGAPILRLDDINIYDPTVVGISDNSIEENKLLLYPNPNHGSFQIELSEDLIGEEYYIYNLSGQSIRSGNFKNRNEPLDISNEKAGIYFLQVPIKGINKKVVVY